MTRRSPPPPPPSIVVTIKTREPIEVDDFAAIYTALGNQYRKFVQANFPEAGDAPTIYVKQVAEGSIIVDLVPWVMATWHPFRMNSSGSKWWWSSSRSTANCSAVTFGGRDRTREQNPLRGVT